MPFADFLFWSIALLTALCSVTVVVTQNIVRAAIWLLFTLAGTAGLYFLLGADFIGSVQLLIYVGGTLVLVIFGVMLTAQQPFIQMKSGAGEWALSLIVGLLLYGLIAAAVLATDWGFAQPDVPPTEQSRSAPAASHNSTQLGLVLLGFEKAMQEQPLSVQPKNINPKDIKMRRRMGYLLPFIIISVHLLVVLIGAAYLARARRRKGTSSS